MKHILEFKVDESGATLVEYGVALILAITLGTVGLANLSEQTASNMSEAGSKMDVAQYWKHTRRSNAMYSIVTKWRTDDAGATLVEYGVALLVVIIVGGAAIGALGTAVGNEIGETASAF